MRVVVPIRFTAQNFAAGIRSPTSDGRRLRQGLLLPPRLFILLNKPQRRCGAPHFDRSGIGSMVGKNPAVGLWAWLREKTLGVGDPL